jgi:CheY-like chemotaxis protein
MTKSSKSRILIVEDQKSFREAAEFELQTMGFETSTAEEGERGFRKACEEAFDLIISDIRMPGWDGVRLLTELRKKNPQSPPFLFMSGFSDFSIEVAYDMGADGLIAKPFSSTLLAKAIKKAINPMSSRWASPEPSSEKKITGQFRMIGDLAADQGVSLGRGGFFIQGFGELESIPIGSSVNYEFNFLTGDVQCLEGSGTLVWKRLQHDKPLGIEAGLSITRLSPNCRNSIIDYIVNQKLIPFIPNHHSE